MKIAIASDHAGFNLKEKIKNFLVEKKYKINDFGTYNCNPVDYPDYIRPATESVVEKKSKFGIILCGTGQGVSITANRYKGARAALCWNIEICKLARRHNNANILSIPALFISELLSFQIINVFFSTDFEGGRHEKRIKKIEY